MRIFNNSRTFGIEIEFLTTVDRTTVARALTDKGINAEVQGYNHSNSSSTWKLVTDASCGYELVSPILKGQDGINQLKIVMDTMKELNIKVDKRCGLHIHWDANDLTVQHFKNIYCLYAKYEHTIDSVMPESRRANNGYYCRSVKELISKIKTAKTIRQITEMIPTRYYKINCHSYLRHGTVEFRQHGGTIEFDKVYNWLLLTQAIVETAKEKKTVSITNFQLEHEWYYLGRELGFTKENKPMIEFFKTRQDKFNTRTRLAS